MINPRPTCTLVIQVKGAGPLRINSSKSRAELHALMKEDVIKLKSVDKTEVLDQQRNTLWLLVDEELVIAKEDVIFYTIAETKEPPKIDTSLVGLVNPSGQPIQ